MTVGSRTLALLARLPPARTYDIAVERGLRVPMLDGIELVADRYFASATSNAPIVLIRSAYGRHLAAGTIARLFAERGYQVVIQSVRGTFGSGGRQDFRRERADGRATLDWLAAQPWFSGSIGMVGSSYLGGVQWAIAANAPGSVKALAPHIAPSRFRAAFYSGDVLALDTALRWAYLVEHQERAPLGVVWSLIRADRALAPAFMRLPLAEADRAAVGHPVDFYQGLLVPEGRDGAYTSDEDYASHPEAISVPINLLTGWYDLMLTEQLAGYAALRQAGHRPHLTIGPWTHTSLSLQAASLRESLAWLDAHLRADGSRLRASPIRVFIMGAGRWLDLDDWPPPAVATSWHLGPAGALDAGPPARSAPDRYDYDPRDPTPSVGGPLLAGPHAGPKDNRALEARRDVLSYTTRPLERDVAVIGPVAVELHFRSSVEHTDLFARLCDVDPRGRSTNICDGLVRLRPGSAAAAPDGTSCVRIDLSPTACRFTRGHRIRLQVSSGAHPRFNRNLGTGEPLATATELQIAHQEVHHDEAHPSRLVLPVAEALLSN